ncbi:MAG: acetate--CoA ligase family protein [Opitutae bacterium]|nr:acetate--CoA ligase family protein [Opitutae bacterium]
MSRSGFVHEAEAYALLQRAGLKPPRHALGTEPPAFEPGEPVVAKGLGENVWHKTELGAVHFLPYDRQSLCVEFQDMRSRVEAAGHRWIDGLVCEQIDVVRSPHLPSEAFVSLARGEAGWVLLCGFGGLQADTLAKLAPPLRWPLLFTTPDQALAEFESHLLGRIWLGRERGTKPMANHEALRRFFEALWPLAALAEAAGLTLLELNPVALDRDGTPRPLDAVGSRGVVPAERAAPPAGFLAALRAPRRIALAGVSAKEGSVGRTVLENLSRYPLAPGDLVIIKPGEEVLLGYPCLPDVKGLLANPVDLLLVALPAPIATDLLLQLVAQGGGARCVALIAGGIGDGADETGLGARLTAGLQKARTAGRWTPAVLGPNFLGHWAPGLRLHTSFIPASRLAPPSEANGDLVLLSQSGALLLCLLSRQPGLRFNLAVALGNQMDVALCDVLTALADEPGRGPVACYVEGFGPGQLLVAARAIGRLRAQGRIVLLHRAGRTAAGQAAAASHTGAMASDIALERALLERAGARFADTLAEFEAALTWLSACPQLETGPVAVVTNAGFESVNASDLFGPRLPAAQLEPTAQEALRQLLVRHKLDGLVAPRLPLDLTPMAGLADFIAASALLLSSEAVLVLGLVPFSRQLDTSPAGAAQLLRLLSALRDVHRKPIAVVVDSGPEYDGFRDTFRRAGLPVFQSMEAALQGLRALGVGAASG